MMRRLPQDQLAPPHRRDRRRASTHERAHAPRILRRDPGLHRQPCDAIPALRRGRPAVQTARERRRAEVRRPAVHVQPRAGRALLPLSLPRPPSPEATPSCEETGILGAVTGVIGSLQALEAITIIVGLHGKFLLSSN